MISWLYLIQRREKFNDHDFNEWINCGLIPLFPPFNWSPNCPKKRDYPLDSLSPLFRMAVINGVKAAVLLQLQRGADVNATDNRGRSALFLAAEKGHAEICRVLLEAGADPSLRDTKENDPLSIAIKHGWTEVETLLRQHVAPPRPESRMEASTFGDRTGKALLDEDSNLSQWEEEETTASPEGDSTCLADAQQMQGQISRHVPVDTDEDWTDVDIDLPELLEFSRRRLRTWEENAEWHIAARQLLLAGIRNGWVNEQELVRAVPPDEKNRNAPDQEHLAALRVVLGELDVQVLDALDALVPPSMVPEDEIAEDVNLEDPVELRADEALVFLSDLHSYTNDPLTQYVKDIGSSKVLSREEEVELACEISAGIREALGSIPRSSFAMAELLDQLKHAEQGDVSIKSIISNGDNTDEETSDEESENHVDDDKADVEDVKSSPVKTSETTLASEFPADLHDKFESIRALHRAMTSTQSILERESLAGKLRDAIYDLGISTEFMEHLWLMVEKNDLNPEAEKILARGLRRAQAAKNEFALANLKLVMWVARKFGGLPYIEIVQEGNIGLLKAIDRFNPFYGTRFSTYAVWWIRQSIFRGLANKKRLIRLPVHVVDSRRKIQSAWNILFARLQRKPTTEELALEVDIPEHLVRRILHVPEDPIPIPSIRDLEQTIEESFADLVTPSPEDIAIHTGLKEALEETFQSLTEKEADVIRLRFGLVDDKDHTLEQIGQLYGLTRERIRQIEAKALRKLAHPAHAKKLSLFLE